MELGIDVNEIIKELCEKGVIDRNTKITNKMNGTTEGQVYTLAVDDNPKYVFKLDSSKNILRFKPRNFNFNNHYAKSCVY